MLTWLALISVASAGDVLIPTFTPKTTSDFGPAELLTEETLKALGESGITFVPPAEIQRRAGMVADGCAEEPDCTTVLWDEFPPARLVVVGEVTREEGQLTSKVRFYGRDDASPLEVLTSTFPEHEAAGFAEQIAFFATELLSLVPEAEIVDVPVAAEPEPPVEERPPAITVTEHYPPHEPEGQGEDESWREVDQLDVGPELRREDTGLPEIAWERFEDSGEPYDEWAEASHVRTGKVILELHGGFMLGDVDRIYDTRVAVNQLEDGSFEQTAAYQYESFVRGQGFSVGGAVGYAPTWWFEAGIGAGLMLAHKQLTTGWEHYKDGVLQASDSEIYDSVAAQLGYVEPRVRVYFVATGVVKPYIMGGANVRFYDGYAPPDLDAIDYPDRSGGAGVGAMGGGGIAFDVPGGAVGLIEVPWTWLLGPEPYTIGASDFSDPPEQIQGAHQTLTFRVGMGVRL